MAERINGETIQVHLLVLRCQVGDERAFGKLYDLFSKKTLAYLQGMLGDDASDVQQDLWLSVYRGIRGIGNPHAFRSWLFRSTRRKAIDFLRGAKREREWLDDISIDELDASTEGDSNYEDIDIASLDVALAGIPPPQRPRRVIRVFPDLLEPFIISLGTVSLSLALASTIAIFLRVRTASLNEIQLRLAALEDMLVARADKID